MILPNLRVILILTACAVSLVFYRQTGESFYLYIFILTAVIGLVFLLARGPV